MVIFLLSEYFQILFRSHHAGQLDVEGMSEYIHQDNLPVISLKTRKIRVE